MVQYVSHPQHTWSRLREEHTDEYENPLPHPPDPDEFFKARIVVSKPEIRVYVGDDTEPCLVVSELTDRTGGRVGLWMGNGSDGSFAELVIRRLEGVVIARSYSLLEYNVSRAKLADAEALAPGYHSPTVTSLEDADWCAVRVMVPRKQVSHVMDQLEQLGATAVLETKILNCRL